VTGHLERSDVRRIINSTYVSLDGVMEHMERWHFEYIDDDATAFNSELLSTSDALLMGRLTYESFAEAWPPRSGELADKINAMNKYVASSTLEQAEWRNSTIIEGDLADAVAKLKQEPGQDILMFGFGPVAETLLKRGLLDELHVWVHPLFAGVGGVGDTLLRDGNSARFELAGTRTFGSGVVVLSYRPEAS
jgi:dihydrofolate reductase